MIGKVAREGQRYPCWRHDMMMMMMIIIPHLKNLSNLLYVLVSKWFVNKFAFNEVVIYFHARKYHNCLHSVK